MYTGTNNSFYPHVQMNITRKMEIPLIDGYTMCIMCMASVTKGNSSYHVDMSWSGIGMQQSLWVNQLEAVTYRKCIVRKLCFSPWLNSQAGEYTCYLTVEGNNNFKIAVNKTIAVYGMYVSNGVALNN